MKSSNSHRKSKEQLQKLNQVMITPGSSLLEIESGEGRKYHSRVNTNDFMNTEADIKI